jgi:ribosomal protein S19
VAGIKIYKLKILYNFMGRSKWKNLISFFNIKKKYIWKRGLVISSFMLNNPHFVYIGKTFKRIYPTRDKIGYSFGDFCRTRKYTKKKITKVKKK